MSGADLVRTHLVEQLAPDPGWHLDALVGTTYGLDVQTLFALLIGVTGSDLRAASDGTGRLSSFAVLQALIPMVDRVRVVGDRANIKQPKDVGHSLLALMDGVIRDVHVPNGCFHPKVWVARYTGRAAGAHTRLRILCSSRNLTHSTSWELFTAIDAVEDGHGGEGICRDTAALFDQLRGPGSQRGPIPRIVRSLRRAVPVLGGKVIDQARLWHQWPGGRHLKHYLPAGGDHLLVVSPFLTQAFLDEAMKGFARTTLISCVPALDELETGIAARLSQGENRVWAMRRGLTAGAEEGTDGHDDDEAQEVEELDLHAKLLIAEDGDESVTFLGSANATFPAWFGRNVEAVLEMKPALNRREFLSGFAVKEGDPDAPTDELVLREWLMPWEPRPDEPVDEELMAEQQARARLEDAIGFVAGLDLQGTFDGQRLSVRARCSRAERFEHLASLEQLGADVDLSWSLVTVTDERRTLADLVRGSAFQDLSPTSLTELLSVHAVSLRPLADGRIPETRNLFRFTLDFGDWRTRRNQAIYRELLTSADFDKLLRAMLSGLPASTGTGGGDGSWSRGPGQKAGGIRSVSLEQLLRACTRDPALVEEIETLVTAFEHDPELIGEDFKLVWKVVREAFRGSKRGWR